jgi:hypothetical protein
MATPPRRNRVAATSSPLLQRLGRVPPVLVAVVAGACVLVALLVGSRWSALALLPVVALLGWLSHLSWPRLSSGHRLVRLVVLGALVGWLVSTLLRG